MKRWFERDVGRLVAGLTGARIIVPPARSRQARTPRRPRGGPVPIPFYFEPSPHSHEHVEVAVVLRGPVYVELEGAGRSAGTGSVILFPSNTLHYDSYITPGRPYSMLWFVLWLGRPRANISTYTPKKGFELTWAGELRPELIPEDDWAFAASIKKGRKPDAARTRAFLWALFVATLAAMRQSGPMKKHEVTRKVVRDAVSFLGEHLAEAPTVEMAAEFVGLSPTYLTTIVRKELGEPLHDVLAGLRLEKAKELLEGTSLSVKEVAHQSGFSTADYFSRAFRKATGATPGGYRERGA